MDTKYTLKLLQFFIFFSLILSVYGQDQVSDGKLSDEIQSATSIEASEEQAPAEEKAPAEEEAPAEEKAQAEEQAPLEESTGIAKLFGIITLILFGAVVILLVWNLLWPALLSYLLRMPPVEREESENIQEDELVKNKNVATSPFFNGIIYDDTQNKQKISYLIEKGAPLPCSKTETLYTLHDNQTLLDFKIIQSPTEEDDPEMVKVISESSIEIPEGSPADTPMNVTLSQSEDAALSCSAEIEISGSKKVFDISLVQQDEELLEESEPKDSQEEETIQPEDSKELEVSDNNLTTILNNVVLKKVGEWFKLINTKINKIEKKVDQNSDTSLSTFKQIEEETGALVRTMSDLNATIERQNKEIDRLKEGYDYSIKKDSFKALIGLNDLVNGFINESDINEQTATKLKSMQENILSYLNEMDVEIFTFEPGTSYREIDNIIKVKGSFEIEPVSTNDPTQHEKVQKTVKVGYAHYHQDGKNVVRPATINVFTYKEEDTNDR